MQQRGERRLAPTRGAEEAGCAAVEADGAGVEHEVAPLVQEDGEGGTEEVETERGGVRTGRRVYDDLASSTYDEASNVPPSQPRLVGGGHLRECVSDLSQADLDVGAFGSLAQLGERYRRVEAETESGVAVHSCSPPG
jgi:hypothetical protein